MPMTTISSPKAKRVYSKFNTIARTDTTAKDLMALPKGAFIVGAYVLSPVASDAGTTATISFGTSATANEFMAGYDVKTVASGLAFDTVGGKAVAAMFTQLAADTVIKGIYAESGTASAAGGPFTVRIDYVIPGPNETLNS